MEQNYMQPTRLPSFSEAWGEEYSGEISSSFLAQGFGKTESLRDTYPRYQRDYTANEEEDASTICSVSPSDEEAYAQELNGEFIYESSESDDDEVIFAKPMNDDFPYNKSERALKEISRNTNNASSSHSSSRDIPKASNTNSVSKPKSTDFLMEFSPELKLQIEEQILSLITGYLDWKIELPKHYGTRMTMLSEVFRVNLNTLVRGEYWFGTDFIMDCNQQRAPKGAVFVGLIISEGTYGKKYLMLNGRERVELFAGYTEAVTDLETIQVSQDGILIMYSKGKSSYQTVRNAVLRLFYDYNPEMVFIGLITPDRKFKVNILGHDEVIDLDYFGADCQIIYRDLLCIQQKTYPVRAVVLRIVSDNVAIADFNYSYACGVVGKYVPKKFSFLIPAGVNPLYF